MTLKRAVFLTVVIAWVIVYSAPELNQDRILPYDSAGFAANGALFLTLFNEMPRFTQAPVDWLWEYYHQYPAQSVRRHPPLFGLVEAAVYSVTGVSVFGANLTNLLFFLVFAVGAYAMVYRFWKDDLVALAATMLVLTTPWTLFLMRTLWLDIPSLATAVWAFYFYARRLEGHRGWGNTLLIVLFMTLSLYTYQLPICLLAALVLHCLVMERKTFYKDRALIGSALVFAVLLAPLVLQQAVLARDNVSAAGGGNPFAEFCPEDNKLSFTYWAYYARVLGREYPVQAAGMLLWAVLLPWRRLRSAEGLFALCFVVSYLAFSWMAARNERYMTYPALAASVLTVLACRDLFGILLAARPALRAAALPAVVAVACATQALAVQLPAFNVAHVDKLVEVALSHRPDARILYWGDLDCSFIFYLRKADAARQARAYRAKVQLEDPNWLPRFLEDEKIDVIIYEVTGLPVETALHTTYREKIEAHLTQSPNFHSLGQHGILYGPPGREHVHPLMVYARTGPLPGSALKTP